MRNGVTHRHGIARFAGFLYHTDSPDLSMRSFVQLFSEAKGEGEPRIINARTLCSNPDGPPPKASHTPTTGLLTLASLDLLGGANWIDGSFRLHIGQGCVQREWGKWYYTTKLRFGGKLITTYLTEK